ncbi:hypothetical protein MJH12_11915, partial [bacterium]|nr:hypothetical protein [bacterium]
MNLVKAKFQDRVLIRYQLLIETYHKSRDRVIDLEANTNLFKTQIKELSKHLGILQTLLKSHETLIPTLESEVIRLKKEYLHIEEEHKELLNYEVILKDEISSIKSEHKELLNYETVLKDEIYSNKIEHSDIIK